MHDVARRCDMNCERSKDTHKQLAQRSLNASRRYTVVSPVEIQTWIYIGTPSPKIFAPLALSLKDITSSFLVSQ